MKVEIVSLRDVKEKIEAESKSGEKLKKIRENSKLFNRIIEEKVASGELINVDISKYKDDHENSGSKDVTAGIYSGVSPKMFKCALCDFITQNGVYFTKHVNKVHGNNSTCKFCYKTFKSEETLKQHSQIYHREGIIKKRPCRFFRNGSRKCNPMLGKCQYDHTIVPDDALEFCRHKQACKYKPFCIFRHPDGQTENDWQKVTKNSAKICKFTVNGETCPRLMCNFLHPVGNNAPIIDLTNAYSIFQAEQLKEPPLMETAKSLPMMTLKEISLLSKRVPVIVRNVKISTQMTELSKCLQKTNIS